MRDLGVRLLSLPIRCPSFIRCSLSLSLFTFTLSLRFLLFTSLLHGRTFQFGCGYAAPGFSVISVALFFRLFLPPYYNLSKLSFLNTFFFQ